MLLVGDNKSPVDGFFARVSSNLAELVVVDGGLSDVTVHPGDTF